MLTGLALIFLLAALAPALHRFLKDASGWALAALPAGLFVFFLLKLRDVNAGGPVLESTPWIPSLGIDLAFRFDGLSIVYLLLISGIGALISIYAGGYLHGHPMRGRFFAYLYFFMGAMLGVVSSDNLLSLFVFWELTSLSSYLLIGFNHEDKTSRSSALQALLVTFAGGQALLLGILIAGFAGGTFSISELLKNPDVLRDSAVYLPVLLLILAGAFTKSAQTPFHFWLPGAMAAPTPVSAYLHSATMVTAGVFLLARLAPLLGGTPVWFWVVTLAGLLTMVTGAALSVGQTDLKRLLAYTTVSALGTMVLLLGLGTELAAIAAVGFLLVHSLYKGSLFMMAGAVDHETHTRDVTKLGGLVREMPVTAAAAGLAAFAMCGVPPVLGFITKELLYEAKLELGGPGWILAGLGVVSNALIFAVALIVGVRPFVGDKGAPPKHPHEAPPSLWLGPVLLAVLGLLFGLAPMLVDRPLITPAASAVLGTDIKAHLYLWHGITPMLILSAATVALGFFFFKIRVRLRDLRAWLAPLARFGPTRAYELLVYSALPRVADSQTRFLQHGYLRYYVMTVLAAAAAAVFLGLSRIPTWDPGLEWRPFEWYELLICAGIFASGIAAILVRGRLSAVALLGIVGYSIALIFALYGAPDLAITQFLVETLLLLLLVLVLYHMPMSKPMSSVAVKVRDAVICAMAGFAITLVVLKSFSLSPLEKFPAYYVENSPVAQGKNVVNVILVDFRAVDTLGEITVLAAAAFGVYAILRFPTKRKEKK